MNAPLHPNGNPSSNNETNNNEAPGYVGFWPQDDPHCTAMVSISLEDRKAWSEEIAARLQGRGTYGLKQNQAAKYVDPFDNWRPPPFDKYLILCPAKVLFTADSEVNDLLSYSKASGFKQYSDEARELHNLISNAGNHNPHHPKSKLEPALSLLEFLSLVRLLALLLSFFSQA